MFNSETKKKFIQDRCTSISTADGYEAIFNEVSRFEEGWGADICTQSTDTLSPVMENLFGYRLRGKKQKIVLLKDYVKWCIENNVPGACRGMLDVEVSGVDKIRTVMVANPVQLQKYLNQICDPELEKTTDLTVRCFYWMAFAGISEEDIQNVTGDDIDFDHMVIKYGGNEYEIYRESVLALRLASSLTEFVYKHPNYQSDTPVIKNRVLGKELIRGIKGKSTVTSMRTQLSRRSKACFESGRTDMQLSYKRVHMSGLFYRMRMHELAGIPVNFSSEAKAFMADKTYNLSSGRNTIEAMQRKIANDYLNDYKRWKEAFSI